jgi:heme-degrading monooxygenase HmoA
MNTTPELPYYAVIFTSKRTSFENNSYEEMAKQMVELAKLQDGFLGIESARDNIGITVSYWRDLEAIKNWKNHSEHLIAQKYSKQKWYEYYKVRIAKVEREYDFQSN